MNSIFFYVLGILVIGTLRLKLYSTRHLSVALGQLTQYILHGHFKYFCLIKDIRS